MGAYIIASFKLGKAVWCVEVQYVTRKLQEILCHCVLVRVALHLHHQMHLCRQCISYLGLGNAVWVPILLPLLS